MFRVMIFERLRAPGRYLLVGLTCAFFNNGILIAGEQLGFHYAMSILLTFLIVLPASYFVHALWTFGAPASWVGLSRFIGGSLVSLIVATLVIAGLVGGLRLPMIVAAPLSTAAMFLYNYAMTRWAVRHSSSKAPIKA